MERLKSNWVQVLGAIFALACGLLAFWVFYWAGHRLDGPTILAAAIAGIIYVMVQAAFEKKEEEKESRGLGTAGSE